jgi:hypothetical protein
MNGLNQKDFEKEAHKNLPFSPCRARMHDLMHDGWLRACPSYLLGLLYGCKVMNVLK